jgi:hypothetical protein
VTERIDLAVDTGYTDNDSTSEIDDYDNYSVAVGARVRF